MIEIWKPIPAVENYEVSSLGRVRSISRIFIDARGRTFTQKGKIRSVSPSKKGYLRYNTKHGVQYVHQNVCAAFHGVRPVGFHACHNDGNKLNNVADNLRWASPKDNALDTIKHGTKVNPQGEDHGRSKLNNKQVGEIILLLKSGLSGRKIAEKYSVSPATICTINTGKHWKIVSQSNQRQLGKVI
jgi:hypothetical protein